MNKNLTGRKSVTVPIKSLAITLNTDMDIPPYLGENVYFL